MEFDFMKRLGSECSSQQHKSSPCRALVVQFLTLHSGRHSYPLPPQPTLLRVNDGWLLLYSSYMFDIFPGLFMIHDPTRGTGSAGVQIITLRAGSGGFQNTIGWARSP